MKKIFFRGNAIFYSFLISGLLAIILLVLFLTGVVDFRNGGNDALVQGNRLYAAGNYAGALKAYTKGLEKKPGDTLLSYNSGQASYRLNDYQKAIEYYSKAPDRVEKYLNSGNASLKLGDAGNDPNQKTQCYQQALETYKQGIIAFPENIDLKYNYEYVKRKIEQQQNNNNQNQQDNQDNNDKQDDKQGNQGQDNQQDGNGQDKQQNGQDQQQNGQDGNNQDKKQNEQNGKDQQNNQSGDSQQKDNQGQNQQDRQSGQSGQNQGQNKDQNGQQNGSALNQSDASQSGQNNNDPSQVMDALRMLEQQEEESLKNNQGVVKDGKEGKHDW